MKALTAGRLARREIRERKSNESACKRQQQHNKQPPQGVWEMLFLIEHFEGSSVRYYYQAQLARPARVQQLLHAFRNERSLLLATYEQGE